MHDRYIGYRGNQNAVYARLDNGRVTAPERNLTVLAEADIVVAGGGPAGVAAAIAAARSGLSVVLVERYGHLGGLATGGLVLYLDGMWDGQRSVALGLGEEIANRLFEAGGLDRIEDGKDGTVDAELLKSTCLDMVLEADAKLLLHCWITGAVVDENQVRGITVMSKSGPQAILAKLTIDATGDGDVFASAGVPYHQGERGIGLPFRMGNVDIERARRFRRDNPERYAELMSALEAAGGLSGIGDKAVHPGVIWWNNWGKVRSCLDVEDLTHAEIDARHAIQRTVSFMKGHFPGFEDAFLMETAPQLGVRESRQLAGIYCVTEADVKNSATFTDSVAQVAIGKSGRNFGIPYRSLLPADMDGLIAAGRCISVDHYAQEPVRLIPACFSVGHAAGSSAALCIAHGVTPRNLDVDNLRHKLMQENAYIV